MAYLFAMGSAQPIGLNVLKFWDYKIRVPFFNIHVRRKVDRFMVTDFLRVFFFSRSIFLV